MNTLVSPIWTGRICGRPIRFFAAPNNSIAVPWHACADLAGVFGFTRQGLEAYLHDLRTGAYQDDVRTVQTEDGPVLIGPHFMAQGLIDALTGEDTFKANRIHDRYSREAITASRTQQVGMTPQERIEFLFTLIRNQTDAEEGQ